MAAHTILSSMDEVAEKWAPKYVAQMSNMEKTRKIWMREFDFSENIQISMLHVRT